MRSFDPRRVGGLECRAWATYYRREWRAFLAASVGLVRYSYSAGPADVRAAVALGAAAMDFSDRWVEGGCRPDGPRLAHERALLVRSYASFLAVVHR